VAQGIAERAGGSPSSRGGTRLADVVFTLLVVVTAVSVVATIHVVAYRAPIEATMGIVQKIFYFHAPSGYGMYLGATACFIGSCGYLLRGTLGWDSLARAGAEVAVVFGLMLLTSGPLWAAKAWGVYWNWDPRLTTSLLSVLLYVAYVILRTFAGDGDAEKKFASALGVIGAALLPIIHYSVRLWGGTHPQVITGKGGGLQHPDMKLALALGFLSFTLLAIALVWARARVLMAVQRVAEVENEALDLGLIED
jgi:heme exporter protein C